MRKLLGALGGGASSATEKAKKKIIRANLGDESSFYYDEKVRARRCIGVSNCRPTKNHARTSYRKPNEVLGADRFTFAFEIACGLLIEGLPVRAKSRSNGRLPSYAATCVRRRPPQKNRTRASTSPLKTKT